MTLEVNYFNETHAVWEPLLERVDNGRRRWNLKLEVSTIAFPFPLLYTHGIHISRPVRRYVAVCSVGDLFFVLFAFLCIDEE